MAFDGFKRPAGAKDLVMPRPDRQSGYGFQGAHLIGETLWTRKLTFLQPLEQFGIGPNSDSNGSLLPARSRAVPPASAA